MEIKVIKQMLSVLLLSHLCCWNKCSDDDFRLQCTNSTLFIYWNNTSVLALPKNLNRPMSFQQVNLPFSRKYKHLLTKCACMCHRPVLAASMSTSLKASLKVSFFFRCFLIYWKQHVAWLHAVITSHISITADVQRMVLLVSYI